MIRLIIFLNLLILLSVVKITEADLLINELYPVTSNNDPEWVELYNNSESEIETNNYQLVDLANNRVVIPIVTIGSYQYIIATASSLMNNTGDSLFLKDSSGRTIDSVSYPNGLTIHNSYCRCPDGGNNWIITDIITKNSSNQTACLSTITPTGIVSVNPAVSITTTAGPATLSPEETVLNQIFISEAMVNPLTGDNEWLEIYNNNPTDVYLNNWYIDDQDSEGSAPYLFSILIPAYSYAAIDLSRAIFNNDSDAVRLLNKNKKVKNSFKYKYSKKNHTYGRTDFSDDRFCLQPPSKNLPNFPCLVSSSPTQALSPSLINTTTLTPSSTIYPLVNAKNNRNAGQFDFKQALPSLSPISSNSGNILGVSVTSSGPPQSIFVKSGYLAFLSLSYALLTILAIFFKIDFNG